MTTPSTSECINWIEKYSVYAGSLDDVKEDLLILRAVRAQLLAAQEMAKALEQIATPVYLNMGPAYQNPNNVKAICDGLNERILKAEKTLTAWREAGGQ